MAPGGMPIPPSQGRVQCAFDPQEAEGSDEAVSLVRSLIHCITELPGGYDEPQPIEIEAGSSTNTQPADQYCEGWLRGLDLNQRPSGYEPEQIVNLTTDHDISLATKSVFNQCTVGIFSTSR
jgi:hypothetical protein